MSYARIESYTDSAVTVTIGGLENPARTYDCFRLYLSGTHMGWRDPTSSSSTNTAYVEFDITQTADGRTTQSGYYEAKVYGVYNGREYPIPMVGGTGIRIENGGGSSPTPRAHELTYMKILRFEEAEDGYVRIEIETNGYGDVDLVSVTKGWDLTGRYRSEDYVYIAGDYIREDQLTDGHFQGYVTYRFSETDLSRFPSVPVGTCHLASGGGLHGTGYRHFSKAFICMSKYNNWTTYNGTYSTNLKYSGGRMYAGVDYLSTVREDWMRLVNMSFYLDATAYGTIRYSQYSDYIPQYGDVITASMYNSLVRSVIQCCNKLNFNYYDMPSYVSSGDIIPSDFISKLGRVVDNCLANQRYNVNQSAIGSY